MSRVLVSPTEYEISDEDYGKTYNLLDNLRGEDITVDAHVGRCQTALTADGVTAHELGGNNRLQYYTRAFRRTDRELRSGSVDVYHHMNLSYRWFNPLLLAGRHGDTPVVIGPCQAGHSILGEEFNRMVGHAIGMDLERSVTDPLHRIVDGLRDVAIDPIRLDLFRRTLQASDKIVVVHEEAREVYSNFVDESKLEVIPLGVNPSEFEFAERTETKSLVAIGHLRRRKGYDILLDAMERVSKTYPDVHLNVFGDGPLRSELLERTRELGLSDTVTFHGYVDQSKLWEYLADARAFVHPSRSESFSLVRLEAMATGCPVVVSDIDGAREMVRDGTDGLVVPREAPKPLASSIIELLSDFELAAEMGRNARRQVEKNYDWRMIGKRYTELYELLL